MTWWRQPGYGAADARQQLRAVHVISSMHVGGMEAVALRLALKQRQQGHDARIFALHDGPLRVVAAAAGVPTRLGERRRRGMRLLEAAVSFARWRPEIVHAHNPSALHYASLAAVVARCKVVMTFHGQGRGQVRRPRAWEWRRTSAVAAVSADAANDVRAPAFGGRLAVIRNGVAVTPPARPREAVRNELRTGGCVVGLIVARVDGAKGHDTLLRAIATLGAVRQRLAVWVVGDGAQRVQLERLAADLHLSDDAVRFLGARMDVPDLLYAADFFVLPSLTEGLPMSILEAMAAGLPVAATAVGGVPELVVDGETGILVPPGDLEALAGAMAKLAGSPELRRRMGCAGRARVEAHFTLDGMAAQYEALYREALARPARR